MDMKTKIFELGGTKISIIDNYSNWSSYQLLFMQKVKDCPFLVDCPNFIKIPFIQKGMSSLLESRIATKVIEVLNEDSDAYEEDQKAKKSTKTKIKAKNSAKNKNI